MKKIQSVSAILYVLFITLFCLTPIAYFIYWVLPGQSWLHSIWDMNSAFNSALPAVSSLPLHIRFVAWLVNWLPMIANLFTWFFLIKLFNAYRQGEIFSEKNARMIRNIGITLLIWEIVTIPYQVLLTFVMTVSQPAGKHFIAITYSSHDLSTIIAAVVIIIIGWIMRCGAVLSEQQQLTV